MAIDHKLITPMMSIDDPMLSCDILGSGNGRHAFRVNQDTLITNETLEYVLAYRRECFVNRGVAVPQDFEKEWRFKQAPLWSLANYDETNSEVIAWWKFDELNLTLDDGDSVVTVSDSGPNSLTLTAENGILFDADGLNNRGTAIMIGNNDRFTTPHNSVLDYDANLIELYIVWKPSLVGAGHTVFQFYDKRDSGGGSSKIEWWFEHASSRGSTTRKPNFRRSSPKSGSDAALVDGNGYLHCISQDLSDSTAEFFKNGIADGTPGGAQAADMDCDGVLTIGNQTGNDRSMSGSIGEFVIIKKTAGSAGPSLRTKIEGYLCNKWGIDLPSGHTYETTPPRLASGFTG